jgi:hypothetical protein
VFASHFTKVLNIILFVLRRTSSIVHYLDLSLSFRSSKGMYNGDILVMPRRINAEIEKRER